MSHNASDPSAKGDPVQVGTDQGEITNDADTVQVTVHRPGFDFLVTANKSGPLNQADLVRFAAGVAKQ